MKSLDFLGYPNYTITVDCKIHNIKTNNWLCPYFTDFGYIKYKLSHNNKAKRFLAHRLIALCYIPNPDNKPYINHKNGIKIDNRIINLEWCTPKENTIHSFTVLDSTARRLKLSASKTGKKRPDMVGDKNPMRRKYYPVNPAM